ncbi:MAG TPA: hypothetical protein VG816_11050, partial [Solirubrobacterales bacterium]|nr:hypothetical protein [Solirubrobacterales bacterium]
AIAIALIALVFSMVGGAPAKTERPGTAAGVTRKLAKLNARLTKLKLSCPIPDAVDLGTWCLEAGLHPVPPKDIGLNNYVYAAKTCVKEGGWLPSAAQLIGAAARAKLQSTIDDNPTTSGRDEFQAAKNGIKDKREMSGDLFTTTAGSDAAGSEGVTPGSRGNTSVGEPDPTPMPAVPMPDTLDYVTVYDNHNAGGFAGGESVGTAENFRCAYAKGSQGQKFGD